MNQRFRLLLCWLLWSTLQACYLPPTNENLPKRGPFFDLQAFFEEEAKYLEAASPTLDKIIQHNGQTEQHTVSISDWPAELRFFSKVDINKPSWQDQYQVDTLPEPEGYKLRYKALNDNLETRSLDIMIAADTVRAIVAIKRVENQVYNSQQYLTYIPRQRYEIKRVQDVALLEPNDYLIQATYLYE